MHTSDLKIRILIERGKYDEAHSMLLNRLAAEPNDADLHLMMAEVLLGRGRPKEAEASAKAAIGLDPTSGFPHLLLARILIDTANYKAAEAAVRQADELDGDHTAHRTILARIALERDDLNACLEHAEAGLGMDPDDDSCRFFRGIALSRLGRHEEADDTALGLLRDDPEDSSNHSARGWILLERNDTDAAVLHFQEALRLDPANEDARVGLAESLQQANPLLGWFLRALIAVDRLPFMKLLVAAALVGIVIPRLLTMEGMPAFASVAGHVLKTLVMMFFFLSVVAAPMSAALLFASSKGRHALGFHERRAVKWCVTPLLLGLLLMGLWISNGARQMPLASIGMLSAASLLYFGFVQRHPWVRRRMVALAGAASAAGVWLILGPLWLFNPMLKDLARQAPGKSGAPAAVEDFEQQVRQMVRLKQRAFTYPCLAIYLLAAYAPAMAGALLRRAPDESD